ncbi:hypothetical protein JI749_08780 [Devosia oryziradicis]|uniref:DinB family protein n=1 Tax=Devosia oryziradicis TaxID=2801335 RepID=A0ABX7BRF5_9HYPH|nr:hypothetical protein [Devosia oryziradicis]QQR34492.1 hypothetical protein JI749_08780 [Devosia oryziradicis]
MNSLISDEFPLRATQSLRHELLDLLTDADLKFRLPGDTLSLGELCEEQGNIQHTYIQSFVSLETDWSLRRTRTESALTVTDLRHWWTELDEEFERVISGYSEQELNTRTIDRGHWAPTPFVQFHIYREAVLIFLGKASIYLKAMQKPLSMQWQAQIA